MIRRLLLVPLVTACAGAHAPPPAPVGNTTPPAPTRYPAPLYARLFEQGATFRYQVATRSSYYDDQDPRADPYGMVHDHGEHVMTCTVRQVEKLSAAVASVLECDPDVGVPVGGGDPSGTYLATERGLWRMESLEQARTTTPFVDDVIVPWPPIERHSDEDTVVIDFIPGAGESWCWSIAYSEGDDGGVSLCFAGGAITSGSALWAGGSSRDASYHLVP
jgi:hypothetical protein